jgi:1,4-dihydroxy-2-naphthoate octaprenyltransferase
MTFKLGNIMFVPFYHIYVFLNKKNEYTDIPKQKKKKQPETAKQKKINKQLGVCVDCFFLFKIMCLLISSVWVYVSIFFSFQDYATHTPKQRKSINT